MKYNTYNKRQINLVEEHKQLLQEIKKAAGNITIVPNNTIEQYNDLQEYPKTENEFKEQFTVYKETRPNRVVVCHTIATNNTIANLKWKNSTLFGYLTQKKIYLTVDKFSRHKSASVGVIVEISPTIANQIEICKKNTGKNKNDHTKRR